MKRVFKIAGITLLTFIFLLAVVPFAFQSQIKDMVKRFINENLNAQVEFSDVDLSLLRSFPQAHVSVDDLVITNLAPFENETFATVKSISFTMSVKELFKNTEDDPMIINSITADAVLVTLKTDASGNNNYDITKEQDHTSKPEGSGDFSLSIEDYSISNSAITFIEESSKTRIHLSELNHSGNGTFSAEILELDTKSETNISLSIDSTTYFNDYSIKLDALIALDLNNNIYTFKDNKAFINNLPLEFQGYVQQLENGQQIDITFENPGSSFKDFLAVIPETYSKNLDQVETSGNFKVSGIVKGLVSEKTIPKLDISITSNNASFKYPELPKRVHDITINTTIKNTTGNADDTFVDIKTLNFKIDDDVFKSSAILKNITKDVQVNANIDGTLNLANITKAYPIEFDKELSGILKGKLNTSFDMNAIETNAYERIKNNGSLKVSDFIFSSEDIVNPIHISEAEITFNPKTVSLNRFNAKTGDSDLNATGTIKNLLGFLLSDKNLKGHFDVNSQNFLVSDFMMEDTTLSNNQKTTDTSESLKIPVFLDCTINANAKNVVYDNLNLKDVKGVLIIKDQQLTLKEMTSNLFDGTLVITGNVSTKTETPVFDLNLGAQDFDISKSFQGLELLQGLAPISKALQGKLNTTINLSGTLDEAFTPNLNTVSGTAFAELLTTSIQTNEGELFNKLEGALSFIDFKKLDLKDLKAYLDFADGKVTVKPFQLKYDDIGIEISGTHGFDKTLAYNVVFDVPAKYLGSDVNQLIGNLNDEQVNAITIPITANISGTYTNPSVKTDVTSAVTKLTAQLIEIEKQKLLNQGKGQVKSLVDGLFSGTSNTTQTDSTATQVDSTTTVSDPISEGVKNVLGGLLSGKKKKKDSIH